MTFKLLNTAFVGLILTLLCTANTAKAGLIETDFINLNDNLAVYDTDTKLTWLDLSVTDGLSYNAAKAVAPSFRYATEYEVVGLFSTIFPNVNFSNTFGAIYIDLDDANIFRTLFGETLSKHSFGMFLNNAGRIDSLGTFGDKVAHNANFVENDADASKHWHGVFLVKDSLSVPEPSSLFIFALGMLSLIGARIKS